MGFAEIIFSWRQTLARLTGETARNCYARIEQKVLQYFLWRHADAPYADPPAQAEPLPAEDARRSDKLRVSEETRLRLGLQRNRQINVIEDLREEDQQRSLLAWLPGPEELVGIEIHPHPYRDDSLVKSVTWIDNPNEMALISAAIRACRPALSTGPEPCWRALLHVVATDGSVELEVTRTPHDNGATYLNLYTPYGNAPRFRNDALGRILREAATRVGARHEGKDVPDNLLQPFTSWPEL